MNVNEKIDFLMRLIKTTNSSMARFTAMDASHLSRLRRGERSVPPEAAYLGRMATYFAKHCKEDYQVKTLKDLAKIPIEAFASVDQLAAAIEKWMILEDQQRGDAVEIFLAAISKGGVGRLPTNHNGGNFLKEEECLYPRGAAACQIYYGNQGKRQAVLCFLKAVLASPHSIEMLLFSDEDMDWLTEDSSFSMEWAALMMKIAMAGHKINIIHTISRDLGEMLSAISQWMPLYMTGAIKPYYFPRKRDGLFKRTLFSAPGIAAVTSSSIIRPPQDNMTLFLTEEKAIRSIMEEFLQYFSLCRPLMRIFTHEDYEAHLDTLSEFEKEEANSLIKTISLSAVTMPEEVLTSICHRIGIREKEEILGRMLERQQRYMENLDKNYSTEMVRLAELPDIREGRVPVAFSNLFGLGEICYTMGEYLLHLQSLIKLMEANENYQVCLSDAKEEGEYMIYVKENLGTVVIHAGIPFVSFALNESNMTAAFWDYLGEKKRQAHLPRKEVLRRLKSLEEAIVKASEEEVGRNI